MKPAGKPRANAGRSEIRSDRRAARHPDPQKSCSQKNTKRNPWHPQPQSVLLINENHFTVDQTSSDVFITDINNPPRKPYNPRDPQNEFPKMLYHHGNGKGAED